MIPYIRAIEEGTRVQTFCSGCLQKGTREPLVRFGKNKNSNKLICRICGNVTTADNSFHCYACKRLGTLIVCTQGELDTIRMTYYCQQCFTNLVEEWK